MKAEQINEIIINNKFPTITISRKAIRKMDYIIDNVDTEVGWLGTVEERTSEGGVPNYYITDIFVPKQDVAPTTCEMQSEGRTQLTMDLLQKYGEDEGEKIVNALKFWGHSHVNMCVSPTSKDDAMILDFRTRDWFIRGIFNKKGDMKLDVYNFKQNIKYLDITPTIETELTDEEKNELDDIIKNGLTPLNTYNNQTKFDFGKNFGFHYGYQSEAYGNNELPCNTTPSSYFYKAKASKYFNNKTKNNFDDEWSYVWNPLLGKCEKVRRTKNNMSKCLDSNSDNTVINTKPLYPEYE